MSPDEQIFGVMQVIQHDRAVNPDGKVFMVAQASLNAFHDHGAILRKLEDEHGAISIKQQVNAGNLGDADLDLAEEE